MKFSRALVFALLLSFLALACGEGAIVEDDECDDEEPTGFVDAYDEAPDTLESGLTGQRLDVNGVQMLYTPAGTTFWRLGTNNPNYVGRFAIERGTWATQRVYKAFKYWSVPSHTLNYASGGSGYTARLHIYASGGSQRYTWRNTPGYLSSSADVKNQEFTVFARGRELLTERGSINLKIRGGAHSASNGDLASTTQMSLRSGGVAFSKELVHPKYDSVKLTPKIDGFHLEPDRWYGLKFVSYAVRGTTNKVMNRLYVDTRPFDYETGKPRNNWRLLAEYVDVAGKDTGLYTKLANWGGWQTTLRVDGFRYLDFALLSVREIVVP